MGSHRAPIPQVFGSHGLRDSTQPLIVLGLSIYPGEHVHLANPFDWIVHCVFGPQGDGLHGLFGNRQGCRGGSPS